MKSIVNGQTLELIQGDVAQQQVDAIVNAANQRLAGGGGVDGAIHSRGGPTIKAETDRRYPDGCPTGSAVLSDAGQLDAQYVIHTVGPVWDRGDRGEAQLLVGAYQRCLALAVEKNCDSVAIPSLSTGAYRFPLELAASIAIRTTIDFLKKNGQPKLVRFVLFDEGALGVFEKALKEQLETNGGLD